MTPLPCIFVEGLNTCLPVTPTPAVHNAVRLTAVQVSAPWGIVLLAVLCIAGVCWLGNNLTDGHI